MLKQVEHSGELGRLSWIAELGFPAQGSSLGIEYTSSATVCSHLNDDFMVVGKDMSPSLPTGKHQIIAWLPGGLLFLQR